MATVERRRDRGTQRAERALHSLGEELRRARTEAALSQAVVAAAAGISAPQLSRIERGQHRAVSLMILSRLASVLGSDLSARLYPDEEPLRDAAHRALVAAFAALVKPPLTIRTEVPLPLPGDRRAWDAVVSGAGRLTCVEAETRIRDGQALERRIELKRRDGGVGAVLLVVADTRSNRHALRGSARPLRERYAATGVRATLASGRHPDGDGLVLV